MIKRLVTKNFTVLRNTDLEFSGGLNVIIGENGSGKTHLIKLLYSILSCYDEINEINKKLKQEAFTKQLLQSIMATKLFDVFKPDQLGRLTTRKQGRERAEVAFFDKTGAYTCFFGFATNSKTEVIFTKTPAKTNINAPVYFPAKELLTLYPRFVSMYDEYHVQYDVTYYDTIKLLGRDLKKGKHDTELQEMIDKIEEAMGGHFYLDKKGDSFYFQLSKSNETELKGDMEVNLVAEGWRKIGMLTQLLLNGGLKDKGVLFWDEPEANLNPQLIRIMAEIIYRLSSKIQIFITTHSLFLMREIEYLSHHEPHATPIKYFCLQKSGEIQQSYNTCELSNIASFEEEIAQEERIMSFSGDNKR